MTDLLTYIQKINFLILETKHTMIMSNAKTVLHCDEEMRLPSLIRSTPRFKRNRNGRRQTPCTDTNGVLSDCSTANVSIYTDTDTDPEGGDVEPQRAKPPGDKYTVLRCIYIKCKNVHEQRQPLSPSVLDLRMACIYKMEQIMHYSKMSGKTILHELTVIQAIFCLDWIIANEFQYFIRMNPDVLSGVCLILNVESTDAEEMEALYRMVAANTYTSENLLYQEGIAAEVLKIKGDVGRRQHRIVFTDFLEQYFADDNETRKHLVHFLYIWMTTNVATWFINIYDTFVEVALKASFDLPTRVELFNDYLLVCA